MISKCANPMCSTPLIYLREGKIFFVEDKPGPVLVKSKPSHCAEHFWLCGPCSVSLTLTVDGIRGVQVVPKTSPRQPPRARRAYAASA